MSMDESQLADLIARRKAAEKVVEGMPDGAIKEKAFEVAFQHLLAGSAQSVSTARRRAKTARKPRAQPSPATRRKAASGPQAQLAGLVQDGFFDDWKGLPDIVQSLRVTGHSYEQEDLSKPLLRMTRAKILRREPRERDRGRTIYVYRRFDVTGNGSA